MDEVFADQDAKVNSRTPLTSEEHFEIVLLLHFWISRWDNPVTAAQLRHAIRRHYCIESFEDFLIIKDPERIFATVWNRLQQYFSDASKEL
jgi:hypothetical protein